MTAPVVVTREQAHEALLLALNATRTLSDLYYADAMTAGRANQAINRITESLAIIREALRRLDEDAP